MKKIKYLNDIRDFIVVGGTLLFSFIFFMAFWIILFYKVGLLWSVILFFVHWIYEKLETLAGIAKIGE